MSKPVAWVTGAHGFIGRHVARELDREGSVVLGLGHGGWPDAEAAHWGVSHWINGEISASNLRELCAAGGIPKTIIHLAGGASVGAAVANPREDFSRTVVTTVELLEWMRQESPDTRLVVVSSAAVYGAGHEGLIEESATLRPFSPYGQHKLMMENLCRSYGATYGLRSVAARLFSVYGPGLRKQLLWDLCSKLHAAPEAVELGGDGGELRDWVHVRDVAAVLPRLAALANSEVPAFNVGTGTGTTVRDIAQHLIAGWQAEAGTAPSSCGFNGLSRPGDPRHLVADTRQLHAHGLSCASPVSTGIAEYVAWFRAQHGDSV